MARTIAPEVAAGSTRATASRLPFVLLVGVTGAVWLALLRLGLAMATERLDWRYVAEQSRVGASLGYRIAGVWGGMEGSLLLFAGILGVAATLAARRAATAARWAALATVGAVAAIDVVLASPFRRLDAPALTGFGMNPILEHPAMTVHPPMLYAGLAAALGAAVAAIGAPAARTAARPWLLAAVGLLAAAMTLGAAWSYVEQGWGGYWAWDPVENTSLVVWLAALLALHAMPLAGDRAATAMAAAPWALAVAGSVLVRSGVTPSIHGFAEQAAVGWALGGLAVATTVAVVVGARATAPRHGVAPASTVAPSIAAEPRPVTIALLGAATVVVLAGTVVPVLGEVAGNRPSAVRGEFYSRTVGPLALVAVPFLVARIRRWHGWSTIAHAGALVLLTGIAASTSDRVDTVPVAEGATVPAAGRLVRSDGVRVVDGPRPGTTAVVADLVVDGRLMRPALVVYPDRGGRLAESAVRTGPVTDVLVMLDDASDDGGAIVTVHVRRLMWLVWAGAAIVTVGALGQAVIARRAQRRR